MTPVNPVECRQYLGQGSDRYVKEQQHQVERPKRFGFTKRRAGDHSRHSNNNSFRASYGQGSVQMRRDGDWQRVEVRLGTPRVKDLRACSGKAHRNEAHLKQSSDRDGEARRRVPLGKVPGQAPRRPVAYSDHHRAEYQPTINVLFGPTSTGTGSGPNQQ